MSHLTEFGVRYRSVDGDVSVQPTQDRAEAVSNVRAVDDNPLLTAEVVYRHISAWEADR